MANPGRHLSELPQAVPMDSSSSLPYNFKQDESLPFSQDITRHRPTPRAVFDLLQSFTLTTVLSALETAGFLSDLQENGLQTSTLTSLPVDTQLLMAMLEYLVQRGLVFEGSGAFQLTTTGRALCHDKGYLVWLSGGYGHILHQLDALLQKKVAYYKNEVVRDGQWVAVGSALLGKWDVAPYAWRLLENISFNHALDLGCGNARFLLSVCQSFGCRGVGIDLSPEACEEARSAIRNAGFEEHTIRVAQGDATNLHVIPELGQTQLVSAFFVLHEIFTLGSPSFINYLKELHALLPKDAYLLIAEVTPVQDQIATDEWFTPEYAFLHVIMQQTLATEEQWKDMLEQAGFAVKSIMPIDVPGAIMILAQS